MDAQITQLVLTLSQQNLELSQEVTRLRAELAKYQSAPVAMPTPPATKKKVATPVIPPSPVEDSSSVPVPPKIVKKKLNVTPEGHSAHVASGKKVAAINAMRKEFMAAAQLEGEW
jgi:hypothetical protein